MVEIAGCSHFLGDCLIQVTKITRRGEHLAVRKQPEITPSLASTFKPGVMKPERLPTKSKACEKATKKADEGLLLQICGHSEGQVQEWDAALPGAMYAEDAKDHCILSNGHT